MHEASSAQQIIQVVAAEAEKRKGKRVSGIELLVGDFDNVVEEALRFNLEALAEGTMAAGAKLDIKREVLEIECSACGAKGEPVERLVFRCAKCSSLDVEMISGKALKVVSIEIE